VCCDTIDHAPSCVWTNHTMAIVPDVQISPNGLPSSSNLFAIALYFQVVESYLSLYAVAVSCHVLIAFCSLCFCIYFVILS
jgi:hypothetical protein